MSTPFTTIAIFVAAVVIHQRGFSTADAPPRPPQQQQHHHQAKEFLSRCWKPGGGHSPALSECPVDHTPADFIAAPSCRGSPHLVSVVHSAVGNAARRSLIRSTWGSVLQANGLRLATFFVVAKSAKPAENRHLLDESREFNDLVLVDFLDHYRNLTYKNLYGIKWVLERCPGVGFVFKCDDDILVNVFSLTELIADKLATVPSFFLCRTAKGEKRMSNKRLKWYVTPQEWPDPQYPTHCKGMGYLFSADLLPRLHLCAKWRRYFWIDDIFVTGALGQAVGANLMHWPRGWDYQFMRPWHTNGPQSGQAIVFSELRGAAPMPALTRKIWRSMLANGA